MSHDPQHYSSIRYDDSEVHVRTIRRGAQINDHFCYNSQKCRYKVQDLVIYDACIQLISIPERQIDFDELNSLPCVVAFHPTNNEAVGTKEGFIFLRGFRTRWHVKLLVAGPQRRIGGGC